MSEQPEPHGPDEVRLAPETLEALARRMVELLTPEEPSSPNRLMTAKEVADWWGIGRRWVYEHADELGARRMGSGKRPRLRFDPDEVAEQLGQPAEAGDRRRSPSMSPDHGFDSLSVRSRAIVTEQPRKRPRRREIDSRPGAKGGSKAR